MKVRITFLMLAASLLIPLLAGAQEKPCDPILRLPWVEDFQSYPHNTTPPTEPSCWKFVGTNAPSIGSYSINGGWLTCDLDLYSTGETYLTLENMFDSSLTISHLQVEFGAGKTQPNESYNSDMIVGFTSDPNNPAATFVPLDTITAIPYNSPNAMARYTVDFVTYNGAGRYFCFLSKPLLGTGTNFLAVDSIIFDYNDHCMTPGHDYVSHVTDKSVDVTWGTISSNTVNLVLQTVAGLLHTDTTVMGHGCHLTQLTPATQYMLLLRQDCGLNGFSDFDTLYFTTDSVHCQTPVNLNHRSANSSITFDWTPVGSASEWQLHVFSSSFNSSYTCNTPTYTVSGLTPGSTYRASVRAICSSDEQSLWTDTIMAMTSNCGSPNTLRAQTTTTSAEITWNAGNNNTGTYEVVYGPASFDEGEELGTLQVNGYTTTLMGLQPSTPYEVKVSALCASDQQSDQNSMTFVTKSEQQAIDAADAVSLTLSPNPANDHATLTVSGAEGMVHVELVDLEGRVLLRTTKECPAQCQVSLDLEQIAAGHYFVRLWNSQLNITRKVVVSR